MLTKFIVTIGNELNLRRAQVKAVADLLAENATVPFIARYRKELTGSLNETQITAIRDRLDQLADLEQRRSVILASLEKHGHLNDELRERVRAAETISVLEDIYLPYRPKRRTKGTIAREKGLAPLAEAIWEQKGRDPEALAETFIDPEKQIYSNEDALAGARHIMAEMINEDQSIRAGLRTLFHQKAVIHSHVIPDAETRGAKYKDYFDWQEPACTVPSHRLLAMRRGENMEILSLSLQPPEKAAIEFMENSLITGSGDDAQQVRHAIRDSYKRLLSRSMETELRLSTKERADKEAIAVFADNLRELLLAPPLGAKRIMAIDPGYRTGCKVVCLDRQGKLLHNTTIFPHTSEAQAHKARSTVVQLCREHQIEAIAIGNGTAGRETESFVRQLDLPASIMVLLVDESGASVYSASDTARMEFPDHDLTVRGAVSIGRRLMDPLAELVKIDPKSIGVGQYQHDVDQTALKAALDDVVISCVNAVGVDVNRASVQLLTYVSGLGQQLARNMVAYRDKNGPFADRRTLMQVPRLGPKAFEQAAGFLRIPDAANPLDASAVHPESYPVVDAMADDLGCSVSDFINRSDLRKRIDLKRYVTADVGLPTLSDIIKELAKPGRDPRLEFEAFAFDEQVTKLEDLAIGMQLPGIVTNVTRFGAFVDIGVHQDGLVHISEMADHFIKDPAEVVKVHQKVKVTVLSVDEDRKRIGLSMRSGQKPRGQVKMTVSRRQSRPAARDHQRKKSGGAKQPFHNPLAEALSRVNGNLRNR